MMSQIVKTISIILTPSLVPFKQSNLIRDFNELYQKIYDKEKYINL